jgi:hypothetical protein
MRTRPRRSRLGSRLKRKSSPWSGYSSILGSRGRGSCRRCTTRPTSRCCASLTASSGCRSSGSSRSGNRATIALACKDSWMEDFPAIRCRGESFSSDSITEVIDNLSTYLEQYRILINRRIRTRSSLLAHQASSRPAEDFEHRTFIHQHRNTSCFITM